MTPPALLTEWARLLLASLRAAGIRDVVLSPGSRSTPFTWAALNDSGLRCRTLVDERSAAFFAVGQARLTGRPTLLICTSGSAAANYFPAVVEAAESATPLLVLTADRPFELQHAAAPQTIDQTRLFGDHARRFFELGMPDPAPAMLEAVQRIAAQAVLASRAPLPGPVHLNARARKPLEPARGDDDASATFREAVDVLIARGPTRAEAAVAAPAPDPVLELADACRRARRGLILCGPASPWQAPPADDIAALARATGFPIVAEAGSQQRFAGGLPADHVVDGFTTLLGSAAFRAAHAPDFVLQLGRPPTASAWAAYFRGSPEAHRTVVWPYGWSDPWSTAAAVIPAAIAPTLRALLDVLGRKDDEDGDDARAAHTARAAWRARLAEANALAWAVTDDVLAEHPEDGPAEGAAVRAVFDALAPGDVIALGNSLPIRHADTFVRADARDLTVWTQRGANGIDGLISGAAGAAAAAGRPTTLLIGDVSFLHDVGGLAATRDLAAPLTIVILNNGGGRIFEHLPIADAAGAAMDAWLTPPRVDFAAAAATFGLPFARCRTAAELGAALADARAAGGCTVVEMVVPEGAATAPQREILRRLEARLA